LFMAAACRPVATKSVATASRSGGNIRMELTLNALFTCAGSRSAEGTNTGHKNGAAMANVGVRVEPTVRNARFRTACHLQNRGSVQLEAEQL
jgi:hypothetical protein